MAKYKIAWLPGDGVGNDVMEAARIVLDRIKLDAEYVPCDIGWDFWCKEGNALPDRTVAALKETTCGLFGAITSKPQSDAMMQGIPLNFSAVAACSRLDPVPKFSPPTTTSPWL